MYIPVYVDLLWLHLMCVSWNAHVLSDPDSTLSCCLMMLLNQLLDGVDCSFSYAELHRLFCASDNFLVVLEGQLLLSCVLYAIVNLEGSS